MWKQVRYLQLLVSHLLSHNLISTELCYLWRMLKGVDICRHLHCVALYSSWIQRCKFCHRLCNLLKILLLIHVNEFSSKILIKMGVLCTLQSVIRYMYILLNSVWSLANETFIYVFSCLKNSIKPTLCAKTKGYKFLTGNSVPFTLLCIVMCVLRRV